MKVIADNIFLYYNTASIVGDLVSKRTIKWFWSIGMEQDFIMLVIEDDGIYFYGDL